MEASSDRATKRFRVERRTAALTRAIVLTTCFTLVFSGILPAGTGMAQVTTAQVVSLKEVPVPSPRAAVIPVVTPGVNPIPGPGTNLDFRTMTHDIVKSKPALVKLGKALFWDMQLGSDGIQACASCHFHAGADVRARNQISPGLKDANFHNGDLGGDGSFGNSTAPYTANDVNTPNPPGQSEPPPWFINVPGFPQFSPNYQLTSDDFPLNDWASPTLLVPRGPGVTLEEEMADVSADTNDVISSQGVRRRKFVGVIQGNPVESSTPLPDIFNTATPGRLNTQKKCRRVAARNAPTPINAVFNYDNFWDGRASFIFNGCNPFGFRDRDSTLKKNINGTLTDVFVRITNSSLASQAVGPPTSGFEMSYEGRTFPDIGKKMVSLRPLAKQFVHPDDSVLGTMSRATLALDGTPTGLKGLKVGAYDEMIQRAFQDQWWNSATPITAGTGQYTQMEYNFSLFFGLAVQAYEATLVSDETPFDKFMGAPSKGINADPTALTSKQSLGLSLFLDTDPVNGPKCSTCHVPPIMSGHTVIDFQPNAQGVPSSIEGEAVEFMIMGDNGATANYDHGMYNIGVRRTTEDSGRADTAPFINPITGANFPLSVVELAALRKDGKLPPDVARFVPDIPILPRRVTNGAFKVPNLRNIKYTGPYFHNGDSATLRQVVEFYVRGGDFPNTNLHDKSPDVNGIPLMMFPDSIPSANQRIQALVAFLAEALIDQRVAFEKAPFDHPQILIPHGAPPDNSAADYLMEIQAVGKNGRATEIPTFLGLDPQSP